MKVYMADRDVQAAITVDTTSVAIEGVVGSRELELMQRVLIASNFTKAAHEAVQNLTRYGSDAGPGTREIWLRAKPRK